MRPMQRPSVKRPSGRACALFGSRPKGSANGIVFRVRDLLVRQRTPCVNALRGHLTEDGYVFPKGITHVETLVALVEDLQSSLLDSVRVILKRLVDTFTALEALSRALRGAWNPRYVHWTPAYAIKDRDRRVHRDSEPPRRASIACVKASLFRSAPLGTALA